MISLQSAYAFSIIRLTKYFLGCSTTLYILNLHLRETGFLYSGWNVKPPFAVEDRKPGAIAHLALARRQNYRNGILGSVIQKNKNYKREEKTVTFVFSM